MSLVSRGYTASLRPQASLSGPLSDDAREPKMLFQVLHATSHDLLALIGQNGLLSCRD